MLRVLKDGRIPEEKIRNQVHLIKGFFDETLHKYEGKIALLHLDCDLYESYKISLEILYGKVSSGGSSCSMNMLIIVGQGLQRL